MADEADCVRLVDEMVTTHGRLDVLVNNAGTTAVIPHDDLEAATPDVWRRIFDTNVIGTWQLTVAAVPHLRESGRGQVVNVSSLAGDRPVGSSIPYACSKAAVSHMTRLLANTLGPDIRVNAVAPGLVDTPWTADWDRGARVRDGHGAHAAGRHPRRRGRGHPRTGPVDLRDRRGRPGRRGPQPALTVGGGACRPVGPIGRSVPVEPPDDVGQRRGSAAAPAPPPAVTQPGATACGPGVLRAGSRCRGSSSPSTSNP